METDARAHLEARLRRDRDKIIEMCQELTRIPSENPPGDTTGVFNYIAEFLDSNGLPYERVDPVKEWPNLVAHLDSGAPGKHLVLNGHMDVFPAGDASLWSDDPFSGTLRDGKIYGRGVTDMKVGTLSSVLTFVYLSEIRDRLKGRLTLTCVSDEETFGPYGARYLLQNRPDVLGDCLLNGEPSTPNTVRFGEKGLIWLEMKVETKGGHGGYPQVSPNAIKRTGAIIEELESLSGIEGDMPGEVLEKIEAARADLDAMLGTGATDNLERVSVNIGMIEGGHKMNMIAAHCITQVDIRCPVGVPTDVALRRFEEILRRYEGTSYTVVNQTEPTWVDPSHPMMGIIQRNAEDARGIRPIPTISLGGTDARLWRLRGIPAFVYGPTPYNMGAPDEYALVDDLLGTAQTHVLSAYDYLTSGE
jgi:succinyl-diaminopimelate desuccinylase